MTFSPSEVNGRVANCFT